MLSKSQLFLIFSILYVFLNPYKCFYVGKELINIIFRLFKCKTKLYMLGHVF
jgi:hypothetical protein